MFTVTTPIFITEEDTDSTIVNKVSERIGRKITKIKFTGISGKGVMGEAFVLDGENGTGDLGDWLPFQAQPKLGLGGVIRVGNYLVPYNDATYQDTGEVIEVAKRIRRGKR